MPVNRIELQIRFWFIIAVAKFCVSKKLKESFNVPEIWIWISAVFAFKFPARRHLEFLWRNMVAAIVNNQRSFVYNNGATILRWIKNSKWRRPGNLNAKTAHIHILILDTLKLSLRFLEK